METRTSRGRLENTPAPKGTSATETDDGEATDWLALRTYLARRCRLRSIHDRDDCVQDALCVLWERLRSADPPDSPRRFALSVLQRREVDLRRIQLRRTRLDGDMPDMRTTLDSERRDLLSALVSDSCSGLTGREREVVLACLRTSSRTAAANLIGMDLSQYGRSWVNAVSKLRAAAGKSLLEGSIPNDPTGGHQLISAHESRREYA